MTDDLRMEKHERMRRVHDRNLQLEESAEIVVKHGEPKPPSSTKNMYAESATAAWLRRVFQDGADPWW